MPCARTERVRRRRFETRIHVEAILRHCVAIADLCRRFGEHRDDVTCNEAGLVAIDTDQADATSLRARVVVSGGAHCATAPTCQAAGSARAREIIRPSDRARVAPPVRQPAGDWEDGT